jgi:hypothetical protein
MMLAPTPNRLKEWSVVLIGASFWLLLLQPWNWDWVSGVFWLHVYEVVTFPMLFGLLGWIIYESLTGTRYLNKLSHDNLKIDIFNPGLVEPIALSGLGVSAVIIGGISLSLVFQTQESLLEWFNITIYVVLISATVLIYFISMWSIHSAMREAKNHELTIAREHITKVSQELKTRMAQNQLEGIESVSSTITAWVNYQRLVKEAPTWPFSAGIIRRLIASTIVPIIVYIIKIISGLGVRF